MLFGLQAGAQGSFGAVDHLREAHANEHMNSHIILCSTSAGGLCLGWWSAGHVGMQYDPSGTGIKGLTSDNTCMLTSDADTK